MIGIVGGVACVGGGMFIVFAADAGVFSFSITSDKWKV